MKMEKYMKIRSPKERYLPIIESVEKGLEPEPKITDFEILKALPQDKYELSEAISRYIVKHKVSQSIYMLKAVDKRRNVDYIDDEQNSFSKRLNAQNIFKNYHPNFENILSYFEDSNYCYFLNEYTKATLNEVLYNNPKNKIKKKVVVSLIKDIISAVYYLHNMKPPVIYTYLVPEKVYITEKLVAKLENFNWLYFFERLNEDRCRWNRINDFGICLSPEMINGENNEKADIWCIGLISFELINSYFPFEGDDSDKIRNNIFKGKIKWPKNMEPNAKDFIKNILKVNPKERMSLEDMINHPFIKEFFPDAIKSLVKPEENIKYKPYIVSKDNPETWKPEKVE